MGKVLFPINFEMRQNHKLLIGVVFGIAWLHNSWVAKGVIVLLNFFSFYFRIIRLWCFGFIKITYTLRIKRYIDNYFKYKNAT